MFEWRKVVTSGPTASVYTEGVSWFHSIWVQSTADGAPRVASHWYSISSETWAYWVYHLDDPALDICSSWQSQTSEGDMFIAEDPDRAEGLGAAPTSAIAIEGSVSPGNRLLKLRFMTLIVRKAVLAGKDCKLYGVYPNEA